MICKSNLLLVRDGANIVVFDISTGDKLWEYKHTCAISKMIWPCDKHVTLQDIIDKRFTLNVWP